MTVMASLAMKVLGIFDFGDSAITLRCLIKPHPGDHWEMGRQFLLLFKDAFDTEGISIAFPQRDLWIRGQGEAVPKTTA